MLRIQRTMEESKVVFTLSGRIDGASLLQLENMIRPEQQDVVLDLKDVSLASREAVAFLVRCQADGIVTKHCPTYIIEWIAKEKEGKRPDPL